MKKLFSILMLISALGACTVQEPETVGASHEQNPAQEAEESCFVRGEANIQFTEDMIALIEQDLEAGSIQTKSAALNRVLADYGIVSLERVFPHAGDFEERTRREGLHRFYRAVFDPETPVTKAMGGLQGLPGISTVSPVWKIRKRSNYFNDTYYGNQWHYVNTKTAGADINVLKVWEEYTTGSPDVIVCVVDEPVDANHTDLQGNLWTDGEGHTGYNFVRRSYDLSIRPAYGQGDIGHGTHVAGTIAAVSNNGKGVAGIAGGDYAKGQKGVLLQSCAIFSGVSTGSDDDAADAIKWGADHGALISQNSWGLYADSNGDGRVSSSELKQFKQYTIDDDPVTKAAIDYFIKYAGCDNQGNQLPTSLMKGGVVIFAARNENIDWDVYSKYEPVLSVGAFRETGAKASYSNYGSWVDIAAPGGEGSSSANSVWSTLPTSITSSGYGGVEWAGTSMACPHASGVAALLVSYFGGQGFTCDDLKEYLLGGLGETIGGSSPIGRKLDAYASFQYGLDHQASPDPQAPVITLEKTELSLSTKQTATVKVTVTDPNRDSFTVSCTPGSAALVYNAATSVATITAKNAAPGTYTAVFKATDKGGLYSEATLKYTILAAGIPVISLSASSAEIKPAATYTLSVSAMHPDGDPITLSCTPGSSALVYNASTQKAVLTGRNAPAGTYTAVFTVTDGTNSSSANFVYTIKANHAPVISLPTSFVEIKRAGTYSFTPTATDEDEDKLSWSLVQGSSALSMNQSTNEVKLEALKAEPGTYTAVFTVTDEMGATATAQFKYTILENHVPQVKKEIGDVLLDELGKAKSIDISGVFEDIDKDVLSYTVSRSSDAYFLTPPSLSGNVITLKAAGYGSASVIITAKDELGEIAITSFNVAIIDPEKEDTAAIETTVVSGEATVSINSAEPTLVKISIYSTTGSLIEVMEKEASIFDPLHIDVSKLAPGRYLAVLEYKGRTEKIWLVRY